MSVLSDVRDLYGTLESSWSRSQAHIFTHVLAGVIIFLLCGVTFPSITLPQFNPDQITQDAWFKLAKDTGLIYVALVIPLIVISAYAALLRILGQFFVTLFTVIFYTHRPFRFQGLSEWDLEPLALVLNTDDEFQLGALVERSNMLAIKYQTSKSEIWSGFQKSLAKVSQNSVQYLGDFSVLLLIWLTAFLVWPDVSWMTENAKHFWSVTLILFALIWLSWMRVARAMIALPRLTLQSVASMVRVDPEFSSLFQVADERRDRVRERLKGLLEKERDREQSEASLMRLISRRFEIFREGTYIHRETFGKNVGLYERGHQWSMYGQRLADRPTLIDLIAYLYYTTLKRISLIASTLWRLLWYVATGVP